MATETKSNNNSTSMINDHHHFFHHAKRSTSAAGVKPTNYDGSFGTKTDRNASQFHPSARLTFRGTP